MNSDAVIPSPDRDEAGFTLLELLMAITLMGIILVALSLAVTQGFKNTTATKASIDRSIVTNFAARYFASDIASATYGGSIVTATPPACGTNAAITPIIDIQTGPNTAVSYGTELETDGSKSLVRSSCSGTVTTALTLIGRRHLGTTDNTFAPTASCASATGCTLTLSWSNPVYSITFGGTRWVNATTTTTVAP